MIVIDGMYRPNMVDIACEYLAPGGIIIVDNSEGYGVWEEFVGAIEPRELRQRAGGRPAALHVDIFPGVGVRVRPPGADARYFKE